jgi:membrane-associated phospholipid phosphatase
MDSTQFAAGALAPVDRAWPRPLNRAQGASVPLCLAALAVVAVVTVDLPIAEWLKSRPLPEAVEKVLDAAEHFGTFYGHLLILLLVAAVDSAGRRRLVRIAACAWSAGIAANVVKLCIARTRPKYFDFASLIGHGFLGFTPGYSGGSRVQGFPSAHTATAVGMAIALAWAALVGLQRMATSSHFLSDVLVGAMVGWLVGRAFISRHPLARHFDTFEASP